MKSGSSPTENDGLQALQEILSLIERSVAEYNTIVGDVRAHQDRIAKERAVLGALHTRLVGMRKALKGWERRVWDMWVHDVGPHEARQNAKQRLHRHEMLLDGLIWQLFDFREKVEGDQP
jgi:hypothetical protein